MHIKVQDLPAEQLESYLERGCSHFGQCTRTLFVVVAVLVHGKELLRRHRSLTLALDLDLGALTSASASRKANGGIAAGTVVAAAGRFFNRRCKADGRGGFGGGASCSR